MTLHRNAQGDGLVWLSLKIDCPVFVTSIAEGTEVDQSSNVSNNSGRIVISGIIVPSSNVIFAES